MANKSAALLLLLGLVAMPSRAELLRLGMLKKEAREFSVRRDIFSSEPSAAGSGSNPTPAAQQAQAVAAQKTIAEEIFASVSYEGFVVKNAKKSALLNISGEYHMVGEGDQVLGKITILKISQSVVTIEYEKLPYDIMIKGDGNG